MSPPFWLYYTEQGLSIGGPTAQFALSRPSPQQESLNAMKKFLLVLAAILATVPAVFAQDAAPAAAPAAPAAAAPNTPEYAQFAAEMTKYKDALKQLRALKEKYQTATPEERDAIIEQFNPLLESTTKIQKGLVPLALAAYKSVEGANEELRAFLCSMLQWSVVSRENYEDAYAIGKVVLDYPLPDANGNLLYGYAAFAAFCTMHLDDAEKWRDVAIDKGVLDQIDPAGEMQVERY
ncbi:MAG: hypothetical protein HUK22_07660, partial [Thermoguttaceae bacterium]|nr:hypothetical protein [Thermoguttaceae bacterium]